MVLSRLQSVTSFHLMLFAGNWAVGLYPGSGIASVSMLAPDVHRGKALAIHECGPNFSYILAPVITAALAPAAGWRGVALVIGAACAVFSLAYALFSRAGGHRGEPPNFRNLKELARNRAFWVISILFVVAATAAQGIYNVLPTYLVVAHELSERFVNNLVGASRITGFIAIVTAGTLADRYGFRPVVAVILTVTGISTVLLGIADGGLLIASVFLQPLIVAAYFPVALNALMEVTAPERRNLAIAMAIPMATLASAGIAPPLFTAAGARGWFSQSFVVLGALVLLSIGLLAWMPAGKRR
jgi:predicted MFS family arabinose efflux permease